MRKLAALVLVSIVFFSCGKKDEIINIIPYVSVNETIQLNDPRYTVGNIGGHAIISGKGVAGIIVYHRSDNNYVAYDRCSSYEPQKRCAVTIDPDVGFQVVDPCSGSKFLLDDGTPVKAPASRSLRSYTVIKRNQFEIQITN